MYISSLIFLATFFMFANVHAVRSPRGASPGRAQRANSIESILSINIESTRERLWKSYEAKRRDSRAFTAMMDQAREEEKKHRAIIVGRYLGVPEHGNAAEDTPVRAGTNPANFPGRGVFSDEDLDCPTKRCIENTLSKLRGIKIEHKDLYYNIPSLDILLWKPEAAFVPDYLCEREAWNLWSKKALPEYEVSISGKAEAMKWPKERYPMDFEIVIEGVSKAQKVLASDPTKWGHGYEKFEKFSQLMKALYRAVSMTGHCEEQESNNDVADSIASKTKDIISSSSRSFLSRSLSRSSSFSSSRSFSRPPSQIAGSEFLESSEPSIRSNIISKSFKSSMIMRTSQFTCGQLKSLAKMTTSPFDLFVGEKSSRGLDRLDNFISSRNRGISSEDRGYMGMRDWAVKVFQDLLHSSHTTTSETLRKGAQSDAEFQKYINSVARTLGRLEHFKTQPHLRKLFTKPSIDAVIESYTKHLRQLTFRMKWYRPRICKKPGSGWDGRTMKLFKSPRT